MTVLGPGRPPPARVGALHAAELVEGKGTTTIAVCIPARDEARTIGKVVSTALGLQADGLVEEVVVVDDGSSDGTARRAAAAGARVVGNPFGRGKGQALSCAVASTVADVLVFLDADVENVARHFVVELAAPLLRDPALQMVKAAYRRPLHGRPDEGGRVTELMARPLLDRFAPELARLSQPLAGECAIRRTALRGLTLADGYGIEIGLLIDVYRAHGAGAIAEVDLGERVHRNRPLRDLRSQASAVLDAVLARLYPAGEESEPAAGAATSASPSGASSHCSADA